MVCREASTLRRLRVGVAVCSGQRSSWEQEADMTGTTTMSTVPREQPQQNISHAG